MTWTKMHYIYWRRHHCINSASYLPTRRLIKWARLAFDSCLSLSERQLPYTEILLLGSGWMPRSRTNMTEQAFNRKNETTFALCTDPWYKSPWPERAKVYIRLDGVKEFVHIWAVIIQPALLTKGLSSRPCFVRLLIFGANVRWQENMVRRNNVQGSCVRCSRKLCPMLVVVVWRWSVRLFHRLHNRQAQLMARNFISEEILIMNRTVRGSVL